MRHNEQQAETKNTTHSLPSGYCRGKTVPRRKRGEVSGENARRDSGGGPGEFGLPALPEMMIMLSYRSPCSSADASAMKAPIETPSKLGFTPSSNPCAQEWSRSLERQECSSQRAHNERHHLNKFSCILCHAVDCHSGISVVLGRRHIHEVKNTNSFMSNSSACIAFDTKSQKSPLIPPSLDCQKR